MSKYDRFWDANQQAGNLVETINAQFGKWGTFHVDNADFINELYRAEKCDRALLAVTWMNETTFRFYSEPNQNNSPDDFTKWDVGPFQMNVGLLHASIANQYLSVKGLDLAKITGTQAGSILYNGDPWHNACIAARLLKRTGQQTIIKGKKREVMFWGVTAQSWAVMPEDTKNRRRAVAFTGPEARPFRLESYNKYAPMFTKFFEVYNATT